VHWAGGMMKHSVLMIGIVAAAMSGGCKKDKAADGDKPSTAAKSKAPDPAPAPAPAPEAKAEPTPAPTPEPAVPAGPEPSEAKDMLGLELAPMGAWKPVWDPDAKVAKWENEDFMSSIVIRVVTDKLDTIDELKEAAPMMMQLGSGITKVVEEQKTDRGWYAVVEEDTQTEIVYMQKYGGSQIVCSANLTKQDLGGTIEKADVLKACESIKVKP
jgi:hypothetical protein